MDEKALEFPFLTRDQLLYGHKVSLRLRLTAVADIVGQITLRALTRNGILDLNVQTTADGLLSADVIGIDDFPIMLSVVDPADAFKPNQCWTNVSLEINEQETISLCSGFVYADKGVSYPATSKVDAVPGRGFITEVESATPAAGAQISFVVPDGEMWNVMMMSLILETDANVADRRVHIILTFPSGLVVDLFGVTNQPASFTRKYSVVQAGDILDTADGNDIMMGLPANTLLLPGTVISTEVSNFQAGDQYGKLQLLVEKFMGQA